MPTFTLNEIPEIKRDGGHITLRARNPGDRRYVIPNDVARDLIDALQAALPEEPAPPEAVRLVLIGPVPAFEEPESAPDLGGTDSESTKDGGGHS